MQSYCIKKDIGANNKGGGIFQLLIYTTFQLTAESDNCNINQKEEIPPYS